MKRISKILVPIAALLAPIFGRQHALELPQISPSVLRPHPHPARGRGRQRRTPKVPRVGGIAHPPTARLRQCGAWGRR